MKMGKCYCTTTTLLIMVFLHSIILFIKSLKGNDSSLALTTQNTSQVLLEIYFYNLLYLLSVFYIFVKCHIICNKNIPFSLEKISNQFTKSPNFNGNFVLCEKTNKTNDILTLFYY